MLLTWWYVTVRIGSDAIPQTDRYFHPLDSIVNHIGALHVELLPLSVGRVPARLHGHWRKGDVCC